MAGSRGVTPLSDVTTVNRRKIEHIEIVAGDTEVDRRRNYFDAIRLKHRALPEIDLDAVDPSTTFMGKRLSFPLLISSMTGGDHDLIRTINRNLAIAAEEAQVALALGSARVALTNPEARASFELRDLAPSALIFANIGAVQLNYGLTSAHCREILGLADADALVMHCNPLQEAIQREGDTRFGGLANSIRALSSELEKPLILKEVGSGFSAEDAQLVIDSGIKYIDVAGAGGTSWSRVEHLRADRVAQRRVGTPDDRGDDKGHDLGVVFQDWGIPTPEALILLEPYHERFTLIASGGLRTGIDMVKSLALGASLCGMANPFLKPAMVSPERVLEVIAQLRREFTTALFLLGARDTAAVFRNRSCIDLPFR